MNTLIQVEGMRCEGCENNIKAALQEIKGVISVNPDHKKKHVIVEHEDADIGNLEKTIAGLDFVVK